MNAARTTAAQMMVISSASRHTAAVVRVRSVSSVRHRQATPAAVWWNLTTRSSVTYGLFRWLRGTRWFFCMEVTAFAGW